MELSPEEGASACDLQGPRRGGTCAGLDVSRCGVQSLQYIRNSGLDNEMIFHCGFAHNPEGTFYDPLEQMKMLQDLGYHNSFMFYLLGAFLEKSDCQNPTKTGEMDQGDYNIWRERRLKVLEYMNTMKAASKALPPTTPDT